jgi:hypothetical protein
MRLRHTPDGEKALADWLEFRSPSQADREHVTAVLRAVANREWGRWHHYPDTSDSDITVYEPRERLLVCIRLWAGEDQFELARILDGDFGE